MSEPGHNRGIAGEELKRYVERLSNLADERERLADDVKVVKAEAKAAGFDLKVLTAVVKQYRMGDEEKSRRRELRDLIETYCSTIGVDIFD